MEFLLFGAFALSALSAVCGLCCLHKMDSLTGEETPPWEEGPSNRDQQAEERALRMDEGFENLMAYQVKLGRGATTGGEA